MKPSRNADTRRAATSLQKCATLEYILLGDLRDLLEEPADGNTRRWLLAVLDALLDLLPREASMKCDDGYMSEVLDEFPNWYRQVEELRCEHEDLYRNLRALREHTARQESYEEVADRVRIDLRDWMIRFVAHQRHENRLIQTAINLEVGIGD